MTEFGKAFGKIKELQEAYKKSKEMLPYLEAFGEEMKSKEICIIDYHQLVNIHVNGHLALTKISLSPRLLELDVTEINEIVTQQCNLAYHEGCAFMKQEMENFVQNILK